MDDINAETRNCFITCSKVYLIIVLCYNQTSGKCSFKNAPGRCWSWRKVLEQADDGEDCGPLVNYCAS